MSTFTVRPRAAPSANVSVAVSVSDNTEATVSPNTLSFTSTTYSTAQTVTVTGKDDSIYDGTQSYNIVLDPSSSDSGYNGLDNVNVAMSTTDNESAPSFSIDSPSVTEGDSGSENLTFTVSMSPESASQHTVNFARTGGTAISGTDYTAVTGGTLTFMAGETSKTIVVSVTGDTANEGNETVVIGLSNASSGTSISTTSGTGTIIDDDLTFSINSPEVTEGDSGSASLTFTVRLSASSTSQQTVNYAQTGGTAISGTDYTALAASTTLTFMAGERSKPITVSVTGDTDDEGASETVVITLSNASTGISTGSSVAATATGTGTILDDDPKFSINSPSVTEGDSGQVNLEFTVTLSASSSTQYTVDYAQTGGSASSGTDYTAVTANTLTFAPTDTTKTITVTVTGDTANEGNETVVLTLSSATGGAGISTATGTGTITDDDLTFSISDTSVTEGDPGDSNNLVFTVMLSASVSAQHTVDYTFSGTATGGTDYATISGGTLTFTNQTSRTITVSVTGDTTDENNETVVVTLSNASTGISTGSSIAATTTATGMIRDDDPKFSIADASSVMEGGSPSNLVFTVTLSASSTSPLTVDFALGGTANSGTDYTAPASTTVTMAANTTSQTITLAVTDDALNEGNETVVVTLSNPSTATGLGTATASGTIVDNNLVFSIDSPSVDEGDSGSTTMTFTVTLSASVSAQHTVDYTFSGTATGGTDYATISGGTLTFTNQTSRTITVLVTGDTDDEGAGESVIVTLSDATTGISTPTGTGTIRDDDPKFSIGNAGSVAEGESGTSPARTLTFTVSRPSGTSQSSTVAFAFSGGATSGTDFTSSPSSPLTFGATETSKDITVTVTGDTTDEGSGESVIATLSSATGGMGIATASGTGTIADDDPKFSIADASSVAEGTSPATMTFTVTLSATTSASTSVAFAFTGGTATEGASADFTSSTGSPLTFASGVTSRTITVSVRDDTLNEGNETVIVTLSSATGGAGIDDGTATGTITDNDTPAFSIDDASVAEGDSGQTNLTFTVTLSLQSSSALTVNYTTSNSGTGFGHATAGDDYTAVTTAGSVTIAANSTSSTFNIVLLGDTTAEPDETFTVTLSGNPAGTNLDPDKTSATGTIRNDDAGLSISDASTAEDGNLVFTVTLSPPTSSEVTVSYATSSSGSGSGHATASDYTAITATTLTFAAGAMGSALSQTITVQVTDDAVNEPDETLTVTLSSASGAGLVDATGTGTIMDNDTPRFSIDGAEVTEGDSGPTTMTFTVTLSPASYQATTVNYATSNSGSGSGHAASGTDYTAISSTSLSFAAGATSRTFTVSVTGDTTDEGARETFTVTLSSPSTGTALGASSSATGTITDNDPKFSIGDASVTEGNTGSVDMTFTVTLSSPPVSQVTVGYATSDGTATAGDYTAKSSTLTFAANETSKEITVSVTGDTLNEGNETVIVTLSNPSAGTALGASSSGTGTITDNDTPAFSIDDASVAEGDSGQTNLTFTVRLSVASTSALTVSYATSSSGSGFGHATAGTDYTAVTTAGSVTIAANSTSSTFNIVVLGDTTAEPDETFTVTLSNPSSGTNLDPAKTSATGTIRNDDAGLSISDASTAEDGNLVFTVTLSPPTSSEVTVSYATSSSGSGSGHATASDYTAITATTLTFAAGATGSALSQTITVQVTDDTENEPDETLTVTLSGASGAGLVDATGTGTIRDNDTPGFSIDSPSVAEGDSGMKPMTFTVTLSSASYQATTVNYAVTGGTATSGTDFTALADGTLTFAIGDTSDTITVSVTGDFANEPDETVVVTLSNATGGTSISTARGTGTITNDDPGISIADATVKEGDEDETATLTFTVTLNPAATQPTTVDYATSNGTAEAGSDYTAKTGRLTFAVGDTTDTITVSVLGDVLSEPNETVVVTLSNPNPAYTLLDPNNTGTPGSATGTIENDDRVIENELDMEIVTEVAREVTTSVVTAVSSRVASVVGGAAVAPPVVAPPVNVPPVDVPPVDVPSTGGFADSGLLSILARSVQHDRERERGLERSEMSLYRSLDGASFAYSPSALSANGSAGASGGRSGILTVWGSVDYRKMSGGSEDALTWDGELASLNIGTDTLSESGVLVGVAVGASKGSFGYQGSMGGSSGVLKIRVKTLNPYVGWSVSESASLWASIGYGRGKINYNDEDTDSSSSKMKLSSAAFGGRYRLFSSDGSADGRLVQVDLKGEAWGLRNKVEGNEQRLMGSKSRSHGMRLAVERHQSGVLESGASLVLSGEAGVRWDGGEGDTGTGFEIGGTANYSNSATGMKVVATTRILVDHESNRKEWGAGLTVGCQVDGRETGMTYRSSLSHGKAESGVDSLWDSSAASRASSEENSLATRLDAEVGYRFYGRSGLHTPYVGFGAEAGSKRDYRVGMRYSGGSAISSGLEFERREAGKQAS